MAVDAASLQRRSPATLRAFVQAQRVGVRRNPNSVRPATPSDRDYWRFLSVRVPLEGVCAHYQTYDANGDENDWNLNIVPDAAYAWMLDPCILYSLSLASGAPSPIDLQEIKDYDCARVIECELTPDNGLYDKFSPGGLPIESGGWWPDGAGKQGLGPTGRRVGVYGVFAGDYGHGGRPEIHPFDAFWRRFHSARSAAMSWDLGVFQDDSNRFNSDWSEAPIDVEFRVPFCVDAPVSLLRSVTTRARFTLRRSAFCSVVGKNTKPGTEPSALNETFLCPTVSLNRRARNRLEVSVEDLTGLPGRPFSLALGDLTFTVSRPFGLFTTRAWLAGSIVVRIAVEQDGFAYWNLSGPNSTTAADAPNDPVLDTTTEELEALAVTQAPGPPKPVSVKVVEARPILSSGEPRTVAAELVVVHERKGHESVRRTLTVHPRQEPVLVVDEDDPGSAVELESFDRFAKADIDFSSRSSTRKHIDIAAAIGRLAGLERLGRVLRSLPATIELDDEVAIDLTTRYAPFRDGSVQGEEQSLLSEALTREVTGRVPLTCDVHMTGADGTVRRLGSAGASDDRSTGGPKMTLETTDAGYRVVIGSFGGEPTTVRLEATFRDEFGLDATASAWSDNYRLVGAREWVEKAAGISLAGLAERCERLDRACVRAPNDETLASAGMMRTLLGALEALHGPAAVPARQVAGVMRLVSRVAELDSIPRH